MQSAHGSLLRHKKIAGGLAPAIVSREMKDVVFECFHNFVALSQWGKRRYRRRSSNHRRLQCLAPPIPVAVAAPPMPVATPIPAGPVAAPPMPVATPIPGRVGIYWPRNRGRCVIRSCVDRNGHHVDWRWCINRGCIDRRRRVDRWGCRSCVPVGRCRQISDRFC